MPRRLLLSTLLCSLTWPVTASGNPFGYHQHDGLYLRFGGAMRIELVRLNGQWGLLRFINGTLESAQTFETDGERILGIQVQRNPDKLARLIESFGS